MRSTLLALLLLASSCAGTCSAIGGGAIGHGAIGGGAIGCGAIGGCAPVVSDGGSPAPTPPGDPSLWYSAANIDGQQNSTLSDGDPVCTWVDLGSLGVDATQGTSSACPTYRAAGGPGGGARVVLDGGDWLSTGATSADASPTSIAVVARVDTVGAARQAVTDGFSSARRALSGATAGGAAEIDFGLSLSAGAMISGAWHAIVGTANGADASAVRLDGAETAGNAGSHTFEGLVIGARYDGAALFHTGSTADVLIYGTPPDLTDVEAYLAAHHGVTFPVTP